MAAKKKEVLRIGVDFTDVEEADDGDTTRYGGVYRLDGEEFSATGDDRSDNHYSEVGGKIFLKCVKKWAKAESRLQNAHDFKESLDEAITHGHVDSADLFDVVIIKKGGRFTATAEPMSKASRKKIDARLPPGVKAARGVGDLLGDLLAEHLGENEDWLAQALADNGLPGSLEASDANLNLIVDEAMKYVRLAVQPIARKALTKDQDLG